MTTVGDSVTAEEPTKQCGRCKEVKPFSLFAKHKRGKNGLHTWCKACFAEYNRQRYIPNSEAPKEVVERRRANQRRYGKKSRAADPARHAAYTRKYRYGITREQWDALMEAQGGLCAMGCGSPAVALDHDHSCCPERDGKTCGTCFRGILCHLCNLMLGSAKDDPKRLQGAIDYLARYPSKGSLAA